MRYSYSSPSITPDDIAEVLRVLNGTKLTQGEVVQELENKLSKKFNVEHAVVCNSGSAALHMAYHGIDLGPSAGLITSPVTFLSTANAARFCGAPVGFADVDPKTGNLSVDTIKTAVERANFKVRAIAVVHLGGRPCDMPKIKDFADSIGAYVIEDACHAPMAKYSDEDGILYSVGSCSHSHAASLSFHAIKHMTTGEGGVLLTNDYELAKRASRFRSHGMTRDSSIMKDQDAAGAPWYYEMSELGYNYRLSDINCALCLNQVGRLDENLARRRNIARIYHEYLKGSDMIRLPEISSRCGMTHAWHLFSLALDFDRIGKSRHQVMSELTGRGVGTQVHYIPLYRQPYYRNQFVLENFEGAEIYYKNTLSIPMYFGLADDDVKFISENILSTLVS